MYMYNYVRVLDGIKEEKCMRNSHVVTSFFACELYELFLA